MFNISHKRRNKSVTRHAQSEPKVTVHLAHKWWNLLFLSINIKTASILVLMGYVTCVAAQGRKVQHCFLNLSIMNIFLLLYRNSLNILIVRDRCTVKFRLTVT